ncbi:hypothetical protein [Parvibaculum sp.]|jgi:hypothetical protein|uniref:hypothetical protein n=1 Tax=Parvibaculum sp. TaxID=2024848 RepID=UPI002FD8B8F3
MMNQETGKLCRLLPELIVVAAFCIAVDGAQRAAAEGAESAPVQTVTNTFNGMTIVTADVYGNIEARAYSYGPGFCTTHVTVGDKTVNIAAPPAIYSPWTEVISHSGSIGFSVSKDDQCDTGTEVQIRYWK